MLSWRAVFLIKVPLVLVALWLGRRSVSGGTGPGRGLPRPSGALTREAALLGATITAVLLAFDQLGDRPVTGIAFAGLLVLVMPVRQSSAAQSASSAV